jgi:hypothetical protein
MVELVEIIVNPDSFNKGRSNFTGEIYFKVDDFFFPEEGWNDFIIIILNWWLCAFKNFDDFNADSFEMLFMDGPLEVKCKRLTNEVLELVFIRRYIELNESIRIVKCHEKELKKQLLKAARKVFGEMSRKQWETVDTDLLRKQLFSFKSS